MFKSMNPGKKICNLDRLLNIRRQARAAGRTVVHCHGCFDIVHPGHILHLQYARSLGDELIVSVSADSQVNKGIDRPLIPDDLRAGSLAALECVDWVHVNGQPTALELLRELQPDIYVKGKEYERNFDPRFLAERDAVTEAGGKVVFSSGEVVYSSTALIDTLRDRDALTDEKVARFRDRFGLSGSAMQKLLGTFSQLKVVVVGDYILDRYHFCDATGVAGEGPMMALRHLQQQDFDGGAAVVASHVAGLGAQATLITSLADDAPSREGFMRLEGAGISVQSSQHRKQTVVKNRYLVDQSKLFKVDQGPVCPIDSRTEEKVAETILAAAEGAAAVVFADFGYGLITESLLDRLMPVLRKNVPILAADVSGRQASLLKFKSVDLLCPTERELRETLHDFSGGLGAVVWNLLQATDARQAIITLGKQGLVTFQPPGHDSGEPPGRLASEYLPALSRYVVDPLGCGDALLATASLALAAGGSLEMAAYLGALAAAVEIRQMGNRPVTAEMLAERFHARGDAAEAAA
ncbi:MAG: PfkB family carbohydrate kinase [Tepidisphaeraceae bacterium]|jgi:rfaE bifunctional protein kinase chain/domain/rfaE bifunctional protein nucleotidyltransferase chain/domain